MAYGDYTFNNYPWTSSATMHTIQFDYNTTATGPYYYPPSPAPVVEMPEGPMEWLQRRVTEITDLAYAA